MDFGIPANKRAAVMFAQAVLSQDLDAMGAMLPETATLTGLQHATGRLDVLRALAAVFKWYRPHNIHVQFVEKSTHPERGIITWGKGACTVQDILVLAPQTGHYGQPLLISTIHRELLGQEHMHDKKGQQIPWVQQLMSIVAPFRPHVAPPPPPGPGPTMSRSRSQSPRTPRGVDTQNAAAKLPVLDFSFREIADVSDLLKAEPRQGVRVRPLPPSKESSAAAAAAAESARKAPQQVQQRSMSVEDDDLIMIKAKNKKGEEAAYQWDRTEMKSLLDTIQEAETDERGKEKNKVQANVSMEGQKGPEKFQTHSVRLSSNQLVNVSQLAPALKALVHHSMINLTWLDLSCNAITVIPDDLSEFPLQVLYLHSNNIQSFNEVKKLSKLKLLHSLTLWENPIENKMEQPGQYKIYCLHLLTAQPGEDPADSPRLRKLDHAVISRQDIQNCKMYREMHVLAQERERVRLRMVST
eukprot:Hpha_TRINITY_DN10594_c0_g1::TRINITY_DN10594_c0_g1_i1::g.31463::m.31463